jgi:hypothetical protein
MIRYATAVLAISVFAFGASAQPNYMRPSASRSVICPAQVVVKIVPGNPFVLNRTGWRANEGSFPVQLDSTNPPRLSGGNMVCYYRLGSQPGAFMLMQPIGNMNCSAISNGTGFVCTN